MKLASELFSMVSVLLFLGSFFPYIVAIFKKEIQPTAVSWVIWALLDAISLLALMQKDSVNVIAFLAFIGSATVALLSLFLGQRGWSKFDVICFILSMFAVFLWVLSKEPLWGLVLSQIAGFIAAIPTFLSTFEDPTRESRLGWTMNWCACMALLISLSLTPQGGIVIWIQPAFLVLIQSIEMSLLFRKK